MYINFEILSDNGVAFSDLEILLKIHQKQTDLLSDIGQSRLIALEHKEFITTIKTGKSYLKRLRLTSKGKEFLHTVSMRDKKESMDLCTELCELYEGYGQEIGNKNRCLTNLTWFLSVTNYTPEDIVQDVNDWLSRGYRTWLENLLWDKKKANVFTTLKSRDISQSPLYEFMRKNRGLSW
jgi:hypothetical protein